MNARAGLCADVGCVALEQGEVMRARKGEGGSEGYFLGQEGDIDADEDEEDTGERRWQAAVAGAVGSIGLLWEERTRRVGIAQQWVPPRPAPTYISR